MSRTTDGALFPGQEQGESILKSPDISNRGAQAESKTILGKLMDQLDKVLAVLLVLLLLVFFLQSSEAPKVKLTKQSLLNEPSQPAVLTTSESTVAKADDSSIEDLNPGDEKNEKTTLETLIKENDDDPASNDIDNLPVKKKGKGTLEEEENVDSIFNGDNSPTKQKPKSAEPPEDQDQQAESDLEKEKYEPHRRRSRFFKDKEQVQHLERLKLAKYNLITPDIDQDEREALIQQQKQQLEAKYKMSEFPQELSICVVAHASSHKKPYAHQYLLNSILSQDYQHFIVVYIADGFAPEDVQPVKQFIRQRDPQRRVKVVWNEQKRFFLESTVSAIKAFCMDQRVTVLIDGDDELLGTQVFRVLNTFYRRHVANVVYGNFIEYHQVHEQLRVGFATEYEDNEKKQNNYRSVGQKFGMLKSFKTRLISFIKDSDLKDSFGNYYRYAGDYALMYPLLQLACGQVRYMPQFNYLYFGYEIDPTYGSLQIANGRAIRERTRYDCFKKYK